MQKIYCLLLLLLCAPVGYAASCVSVKQVSANYATKQVTFDVVWSTCTGTHNYKTWIIVDYRTVNANGTKGAWTRATVSGTSIGTLVSASKGVWVTGSASKTQRVTLTLSGMPARYDWCANALDYPPQAIMSNGTYTLKGTPPFTINGSTTLGANVKTYTGACVTSVTDVTNNPEGIVTNPAFTAGAIASTGQALCSGSAYTTIGSTTAASGGDGRITYRWLRTGSVISGATATTYVPTQAGTYTRQAKDGTCNTAWVASTGSWVVTVVSIPAVPTLTATTTCEGTAITFTSSAVTGATGYQWNGTGVTASSGTGRTTSSKATTVGNYAAQVRSYTTASGITCYSAYTSNVTGVIVDIPNVPTLTATTTCAGTAVTFTSSSVSGATGYQWAGAGVTAGSGTARTKASNATTTGNYVAQVRSYITASGISCFSAYTSNVTGVIVATPAVPTLTQDGPECVGTAITFTSSSVSGATGYQWAGAGVTASSGTARTKASKATTAGSYIAQVRAYRTASGIICYSAYTSNLAGVINTGGARDKAPNSCGCATGLTALNGYCRDLTADGAFACEGKEHKVVAAEIYWANASCPAGWQLLTYEEAERVVGSYLCGEYCLAGYGNQTYSARLICGGTLRWSVQDLCSVLCFR